jgi:selenocysteine lyase/cysteine desulfurase
VTALAGLGPVFDLVGADTTVACVDGVERRYRDFDCAASTPASRAVADAVNAFLPSYSGPRGAGFKPRASADAYDSARRQALVHAGRDDSDSAILCRNTTEALSHLASRLRLAPDDVVLTTVVEHPANLLPWGRVARRRYVECGVSGTFEVADVVAGLEERPHPKVLTLTGASNVTGWMPPIEQICQEAHARQVPVVLDAAQLAPHRPLPSGPDYVAWSGHKMYAPYGAGILIGPRQTFAGDMFAGGGIVALLDLDEMPWSDPSESVDTGAPNVLGAVAMSAALSELERTGWDTIEAHERALAHRLRHGLAAIDGVRLLGPDLDTETLAIATFTVRGMHHGLVAARLSAECGIGVRHGCVCTYLLRILGLGRDAVAAARAEVVAGDRRNMPGAVRASAGLGTTLEDVDALLEAVEALASGATSPVSYTQDPATGDFLPDVTV